MGYLTNLGPVRGPYMVRDATPAIGVLRTPDSLMPIGVGLVDGLHTKTGLADGKDREMWTTLVLRRDSNGWRFAATRNMSPTTAAVPAKK